MQTRHIQWYSTVVALAVFALCGPTAASAQHPALQSSEIRTTGEAKAETFDWGTLFTYFDSETFGTKDGLAAVAVIKPGQQIHPPHEHAEEEYLMVLEGTGTWSLNGTERRAQPGDMLYAAPWDVHGIFNSGDTPLKFVVWKWHSKGLPPQEEPGQQ